jgi:hypothetical protein
MFVISRITNHVCRLVGIIAVTGLLVCAGGGALAPALALALALVLIALVICTG